MLHCSPLVLICVLYTSRLHTMQAVNTKRSTSVSSHLSISPLHSQEVLCILIFHHTSRLFINNHIQTTCYSTAHSASTTNKKTPHSLRISRPPFVAKDENSSFVNLSTPFRFWQQRPNTTHLLSTAQGVGNKSQNKYCRFFSDSRSPHQIQSFLQHIYFMTSFLSNQAPFQISVHSYFFARDGQIKFLHQRLSSGLDW